MRDWNLDLREGPGFIEFDMEDLEKVCQCNVDAYQDYPLYPAIFGSLAGPDIIYKNWYASVRAIEGNAIMVVDSKDVNGFAIFVPPGYKGMPTFGYLKAGGLTMPPSTYLPQMRYESYCMKMKKKHTDHQSWYMLDLVVRRDRQRQGIARRLMEPVMEALDRTGQDIYLANLSEVRLRGRGSGQGPGKRSGSLRDAPPAPVRLPVTISKQNREEKELSSGQLFLSLKV